MGWRHLHVGRKGDNLTIQNRQVWKEEWRWINAETVRLPDPLIGSDILSHMICEIGPQSRPTRFAAVKLQSELWSFYIPD
ncbi:hypothetical protein P6144_14435 [Sphingomonas sp. HITSZ_GF]|uniref:hypothetical protein n=1 Tax=Sphingomonas sp. HITSZ_GF TaxID=3037247 RepID=UPI00240DC81E|nr:hypothetical protein [Sphingomonas sp. HITSZ_GF]MDG2534854.1 hypothetical protein [Sphingomonas sp. HITSZ_GF]